MWMNKSERTYRRKLEDREMRQAAVAANARFAATAGALSVLLADPGGRRALDVLGIDAVRLGRSMRVAENGRTEGLCILEGIVLAGVVSRLLNDTAFVRYLSVYHPSVLASLHGASTRERHKGGSQT